MKKLACCCIFLLITSLASGQDSTLRWGVAAGVSSTELIHLGALCQFSPNNTLGLSVGSTPRFGYLIKMPLTVSIDHQLRLAKSKKEHQLPTWYFGQRLTYLWYSENEFDAKVLFGTLTIGRHFNFNHNSGLNIDIGVQLKMDEHFRMRYPDPDSWMSYSYVEWAPSVRLQYFFML